MTLFSQHYPPFSSAFYALVDSQVQLALAEDVGTGDLTAALVPAEQHVTACLLYTSAISNMIIAAQQNSSFAGHLSLIAPIFCISLIIWLVLKLAVVISKKLGTIGINIVTRLMGLILAAMALSLIHI